jgi:hypothetical protein
MSSRTMANSCILDKFRLSSDGAGMKIPVIPIPPA